MVFVLAALFLLSALLVAALSSYHNRRRPCLPPGPWAVPIIGHLHLVGPLIHHTFRDLSSRYGPLIHLRLGSVPVVVASTPELARELLKAHETKFTSRKHNKAIDKLTYSSSFAFAPYGPYWKFIKKLCMWELLGHRTINNFLPVRTEEYREFLRFLAKKSEAGEAVNLTEELIKLTNNLISQMMFGIRSSGTEGEAGEARTVIRHVTQMFGEFNVSDFIWFCKNLDLQGFEKRINETHRGYDALLERIITDRELVRKKRKGDGRDLGDDDVKDFLDMLLDVAEDENAEVKITRVHIKAMVLDFFTAATDTTAIATEWALAELINHPNVLERAREEIDRVVGKDRLVGESDGPNLPYIQAIIKESFRLHPPIPMISRKSIEDCRIGKYTIPANTLLFVNMWSIGRDPNYWDDPLDFKPDRFLGSGDGDGSNNGLVVDVKGQHFQLLPFGSGRRGCPGISLAMQELPVMLAAMIQCFHWKLAGTDGARVMGDNVLVDMSERPGLTAPRAHDLICFPVARSSALKMLDLY